MPLTRNAKAFSSAFQKLFLSRALTQGSVCPSDTGHHPEETQLLEAEEV